VKLPVTFPKPVNGPELGMNGLHAEAVMKALEVGLEMEQEVSVGKK
jgi:hypothetical protein